MTDIAEFTDTAARALTAAGWGPGLEPGAARLPGWKLRLAVAAAADTGAQPVLGPAAEAFLREFGGLAVEQEGAGVDLARNSFELDPLRLSHALRTLAAFGRALGCAVSPLGVVENGSYLVLDEYGRMFLIDHSGEWHLGDTPAAGLNTLIDGCLPRRVAESGAWEPA